MKLAFLQSASLMLGLGTDYDQGATPAIAINNSNVVVEVHQTMNSGPLNYELGQIQGNAILWQGPKAFADGATAATTPSVAMNLGGTVIEAHVATVNNKTQVQYRFGKVELPILSIRWWGSHALEGGRNPSVAINRAGAVVMVTDSEMNKNKLTYRVGKLTDAGSGSGRLLGNSSVTEVTEPTLTWGARVEYDSGVNPVVALNESGQVVEMHESEAHDTLWYRLGTLGDNSITWGPSVKYDMGVSPSVALKADGVVYELHKSEKRDTLWQRKGSISDGKIVWAAKAEEFEGGSTPSCATNSTWVVQVHRSTIADGTHLHYSTSLDINRADWMSDGWDIHKDLTLSGIVLPATHDSGMYLGDLAAVAGRCQNWNTYQQLNGGIRSFDLRVSKGDNPRIVHGVIDGPLVKDVLNDVKKYMSEGHRELVILKFSHYDGFNDDWYRKLTNLIQETIGTYLLPKTWTGRLADAKLSTLIGQKGQVLVLSDDVYPVRIPRDNIYVYRDWSAKDPQAGDLTVYDVYSNVTDLAAMQKDQFARFDRFNGKCETLSTPCDLFLFSWTLTPVSDVSLYSAVCNRVLGVAANRLGVNNQGRIPNLLYVDFFERSRVTDIAIMLNKRLHAKPTGFSRPR